MSVTLFIACLCGSLAHALSYNNFTEWPQLCTQSAQPTPVMLTTAVPPTSGGILSLNNCDDLSQLRVTDTPAGPHFHIDGCVLIRDGVTFALQHIEWHVPSEFVVDGRRTAMDLYASFIEGGGGTLYVAISLTNGMAPAPLPNPEGWVSALLAVPSSGGGDRTIAAVPSVGLSTAVQGRPYLAFDGSLTTPPCTGGVRWLVMRDPLFVPRELIAAAYAALASSQVVLSPSMGNARPTSPLGNRQATLWTGVAVPPAKPKRTSGGSIVAAVVLVIVVVLAVGFVLHRLGVLRRLSGPSVPRAAPTFDPTPSIGLDPVPPPTTEVVKY